MDDHQTTLTNACNEAHFNAWILQKFRDQYEFSLRNSSPGHMVLLLDILVVTQTRLSAKSQVRMNEMFRDLVTAQINQYENNDALTVEQTIHRNGLLSLVSSFQLTIDHYKSLAK